MAPVTPRRAYTPVYPALTMPWLLIALAFVFLLCAALAAGGVWHHGPGWFEPAGLASFILAWLIP